MSASYNPTERTYVRLIMGSLGALVLVVALIWVGLRGYRRWEEGHLVRRAAAYLSGGDFNTASLNARRALQLNENNVGALRLAAEIAEKTGDRSALDWRRKVRELNPNSLADALALVRSALWFSDLSEAEKVLQSVAETAKENREFQAASGRLAEMKKDYAAAENHWARAVELAPNESSYRFQLALIRLGLPDPAKRKDALAVLGELRNDRGQRAAATRTLMIDGVAHHEDSERMRKLAEDLQGYPEAQFSDRIVYLDILRQLRSPAYEGYLSGLKATASAKPVDLAALLSWMIRNGMGDAGIEFARSLPPNSLITWPVPLALAEAHAQTKDWPGLEKLTRGTGWATYEFLRHAYLARALRGQAQQLPSEQEFAAAKKEAAANPQMLSMLADTIAQWGWKDESVELLWILTKTPETRLPALQTLYEHYAKIGDTPNLYRTLQRFAELRPGDQALQNNLAQISLLLDADVDHARKMATELAQKDPGNAAYLSTYAFALYTKGDLDGALQVMDGMTAEQLRDPSVATYYGILLAAGGQKEKARSYLERSSEANLLQEEKALVKKALGSLE